MLVIKVSIFSHERLKVVESRVSNGDNATVLPFFQNSPVQCTLAPREVDSLEL
jgi:hypothetical protein